MFWGPGPGQLCASSLIAALPLLMHLFGTRFKVHLSEPKFMNVRICELKYVPVLNTCKICTDSPPLWKTRHF